MFSRLKWQAVKGLLNENEVLRNTFLLNTCIISTVGIRTFENLTNCPVFEWLAAILYSKTGPDGFLTKSVDCFIRKEYSFYEPFMYKTV
jgi:hypothetical protein